MMSLSALRKSFGRRASTLNLNLPDAADDPAHVSHSNDGSGMITLNQIETAAKRIAPFVKRTPTVRDNNLSQRFASNFYLKLELLQNTGAFKVRGAFNKLLSLRKEEIGKGVVAVSGGNHAKAVAYA
ncbi:MAG TPA: pyridoxal-phosphate dependent enzyme, partial [Pyrinomonadaceae bacterium]|nr:pyridoxal-phosphate dependent enzyme [Pyrinomonadaceae bacterium]